MKKNIFSILFLCKGVSNKPFCLIYLFLCLLNCQQLIAQDNQRYLALSLINIDEKDDNLGVKEIEKAHELGFNAVNIAVLWDYVKVYRANRLNPWVQVDNQMKKASELGMKIGLRIWVNGWCGNNQWCSDFDPNEIMTSGEGNYDFSLSGSGRRSMTSFASNSSLIRMKNFTTEVMERYKKYQENGDILYVNLATSPEQELGYPVTFTGGTGLFDYSNPMKEAYRVWLRKRYCNNIETLKKSWGVGYENVKSFNELNPKYNYYYQYSFENQDGRDWYNFRHFMLKRFNNEFIQTVKAVKVSRPFKIINDYGSVFDGASVRRGSMAFQDLGESTDGIKINNAPLYNHRFSMDLLRSNMPNKWIMNEVEMEDFISNQTDQQVASTLAFQQINQSFIHGAKLVTIFPNTKGKSITDFLEKSAKLYQIIKNSWLLNKPITPIIPKGKITFKLSDFIFENGCDNGASCKAITAWQEQFSKNGGQPVEVILNEDFIKDNLPPCDDSGISSEYEGVFQKNDCQGGYGWIINKSNITESVKYEVYLDGRIIKQAIADSLNPESQRYLSNAKHGFSFKFPQMSDGLHSVKIKIPNSSFLLSNAKVNFECSNFGKQTSIKPVNVCFDCVELNIYPNPTSNRVSLGFNLQDFKPVLIEIFNSSGQKVYFSDTYGVTGDNDLEIQVQDWTSGVYLINVKIDQKYYQRKFVKR